IENQVQSLEGNNFWSDLR
ncbi:hypothetical protein JL09_g6479, partial [Pichia kudriavzevii]